MPAQITRVFWIHPTQGQRRSWCLDALRRSLSPITLQDRVLVQLQRNAIRAHELSGPKAYQVLGGECYSICSWRHRHQAGGGLQTESQIRIVVRFDIGQARNIERRPFSLDQGLLVRPLQARHVC